MSMSFTAIDYIERAEILEYVKQWKHLVWLMLLYYVTIMLLLLIKLKDSCIIINIIGFCIIAKGKNKRKNTLSV